MPTCYVSYRNADQSPAMKALFDTLEARFGAGQIIKDAPPLSSENYIAALEERIMSADIMLVVVGPHWLTATNDAGARKIDQADDIVHYEITRALALQKTIVVARIDGAASLTAAALPPALDALRQQPDITFTTPADLDQLTPLVAPIGVAAASRVARAHTSVGLAIAIIAGIVAALTLCPLFSTFIYLAFPISFYVPHLFFLAAWVLALFVAGQQRRWGWLAALVIPVVLYVLWSLWIFIMVEQSNVPGAGDFLLFPIFGSYEVEGVVGILLITFGLLTAGKLSFHWRSGDTAAH